jgi:hypothetical protein
MGEVSEWGEPPNEAEGALWQAYRDAGGRNLPSAIPLDANLLAAYLDGRALPAEIEQVEEAMLQDPDLLETIRDLRDLLPSSHSRNVVRLRAFRGWHIAAAAAAFILVSLLGFHTGLGSYSDLPSEEALAPAANGMAGDDDLLFLDPAMTFAANEPPPSGDFDGESL